MKINCGLMVLDFRSKPMKRGGGGDDAEQTLTVGWALSSLCGIFTQEDVGISGADKVYRYDLGRRLQSDGEVEITAEDLVLLRRLVDRTPSIDLPGYFHGVFKRVESGE